jgi:GT2 family glycosyltransferase
MLEQIGLLDDGYFMYFEDIDHCRRARLCGWQVAHDPEPRVVHLRGGSSSVKSAGAARSRRPRYYYASRSRYFRKFYGRRGLWFTNGLWHLGRAVSKTRELLGRPSTICQAEWRDIWIDALKPRPPIARPASQPAETLGAASPAGQDKQKAEPVTVK